ncbi:ArnT family glycosyltransferase [Tropicimonas sp.]|uniref:ArnT family glycosyltransferase n=1 Tax=Tropicimonas sp. TaxID=2067044 RepID=UPI003A894FDD
MAALSSRAKTCPTARRPPQTPQFDWRQSWLPVAIAAILIVTFWGAHIRLISEGALVEFDEYYTLARSTSFARVGDWWTIYTDNKPNFKKPPLQYWMSGGLLEAGLGLETALRLPSMVFALGCLVATALLAAVIAPNLPWAIPASVVLLASSAQFWTLAESAMLDTGATLFATLALAFAIAALRRPAWWYATAAAIALGALQKAPVGLALVALLVAFLHWTRHLHGFSWQQLRAEPHFRRACWIALAGIFAWPLFQTALHGNEALKRLYVNQMLERFVPLGPAEQERGLAALYDVVIVGEPALRLLAIAALCWMPWRLGRMNLVALPLLFGACVLAMGLASGGVFSRYSLVFLPLLVAASAVVVASFGRIWLLALVVGSVSWTAGGPVKPAGQLGLYPDSELAEVNAALTALKDTALPGETLVFCRWDGTGRPYPGAMAYFSDNAPYVKLDEPTNAEKDKIPPGTPLRGACKLDDLARIRGWLTEVEISRTIGGHVVWTGRRD